MKHIWTYYFTVFFTGASVLIIEIAAVRQLTPIFGGSIYVLSSVLSVILLALSLGYFFGGRLADKYPNDRVLYRIISVSGVLLLLLHFLSLVSLRDVSIFSLVIGPLVIATLLFFLPAVLLGMDSPYVIKLITHNSPGQESGKYVGTTFFWSTIGSITGSISAGFLLIPSIGVSNSITYTAVLLVALGLLAPVWLAGRDWIKYLKQNYLTMLAFALLAAILLQLILSSRAPADNVLLETDGLYSRIQVLETEHKNRRSISLKRDLNHSSAIFPNSFDHVFTYTQFVDLYDRVTMNPENFLMIGGGAYSIPRRLIGLDSNIQVHVVEIEPKLFAIAQQYFELPDTDRITNYTSDARIYLQETDTEYDVIFSDAFNTSHAMPWQLGTAEFYEAIQSVLKPEGLLIVNYIGAVDPEPTSMTSAFLYTLQESFPHIEMFKTNLRGDNIVQNIIFLASRKEIDFSTIADFQITLRDDDVASLADLRVDQSIFSAPNRIVFTDDKAPIEYLMGKQMSKYMNSI